MSDTAAALVIQLSAEFKQFEKDMRAATGVFDQQGRAMEARQRQLKKNLSDWSGITDGLTKYLAGGVALAGIERFVSSITDATEGVVHTSQALGVGTDELQAWGVMAAHAGVNQDTFNEALDRFSKTLGDAATKGGPLLKFFTGLGVDVKAGPTVAFYQFADAVAQTASKTQQTSLVTTAFGKNSANLTDVLRKGSQALKDQTAQIAASGQIISKEALPKIDEFATKWADLKQQFISAGANALAEPLTELTKQLSDPQVQNGLREFAKLMAELAIELAKAARYAPALAGAYAGFKVGKFFGPEGAAIGAAGGAIIGASVGGLNTQTEQQLQTRINTLRQTDPNSKIGSVQAEIKRLEGLLTQAKAADAALKADASKAAGGTGTKDRTDLLGVESLKAQEGRKALTDLAVADAKKVRDANLAADNEERQSNLASMQAREEAIKQQDDALLAREQGTKDFYTLQKEVITEIANLDINYTKAKRDADLAALSDRAKAADEQAAQDRIARKTQLDLLVSELKISKGQEATALAAFDKDQSQEKAARDRADADQRVALENDTNAKIHAISIKADADRRAAGPDALIQQANILGREQIQGYQDQVAVLGLVAGAAAKYTFIHEQLNEARAKGIELTKEEKDAIEAEGAAVGEAAQRAHKAQVDIDNSIQVMDELRSGLSDTLAAGLSGFGSMGDAAKRFIQQLAEMILKLYVIKPLLDGLLGEQGTSFGGGGGALSSLFGGGGGGGGGIGGWLGSLFGSGGGGQTAAVVDQFGELFADGGFTGHGGKNKPAGIVHKGEVVWSQDDVARAGGVGVVEAMRRGLMGYANGGLVQRQAIPDLALPLKSIPIPVAQAQHTHVIQPILQVDARYSSKGTAEEIRDQLTRSYPLLVRAAVQESDKKFPVNLSNNLRDRA